MMLCFLSFLGFEVVVMVVVDEKERGSGINRPSKGGGESKVQDEG